MEKTFLGKSGDLTWYRCTTKKTLPKEGPTLAELPMAKVFNETGIGTMNTSLGDTDKNAMLSFRSSSYGSTSHALANQNAFNTFYGGKAIFIVADIALVLQTIIVCTLTVILVRTTVFW